MDHLPDLPYEGLERQKGIVDQDKWFYRPRNPTVVGGAGKLAQPEETPTALPTFGELYKVFERPRPGKGFFRNVFVRRNKGTICHKLARSNAEHYELCKFNICLHPSVSDDNNPHYGSDVPREEQDLTCQKMLDLVFWPQIPDVPTVVSVFRSKCKNQLTRRKAPFVQSDVLFWKPFATQESVLLKLMRIDVTFRMVLDNLASSWEAVSNLGRTCQEAFFRLGDIYVCISQAILDRKLTLKLETPRFYPRRILQCRPHWPRAG
jgi:hypothetical protein